MSFGVREHFDINQFEWGVGLGNLSMKSRKMTCSIGNVTTVDQAGDLVKARLDLVEARVDIVKDRLDLGSSIVCDHRDLP